MMGITDAEKDIISVLQKAEDQKVCLGSVLSSIHRRPEIIKNRINQLIKKGLVKEEVRDTFTYYFLSEDYGKVFFERTVVCPKCKTAKHIYFRRQLLTSCANKNCKTSSGKKTIFHLIKRAPTNYEIRTERIVEGGKNVLRC